MKIYFDLDDILIDFVPEWIKEINRLFYLNKTMDDIKWFSMEKNYKKEINEKILTVDDMWKIFDNSNFWDNIKPIEGMESVINLAKKNADIRCLTSSCFRDCGIKLEKTLFKFYPDFSWNNTIITNNKDSILGDILIDDNYNNIKAFLKTNKNINKQVHGFLRVTNYLPWKELYEDKDNYGRITLFNDAEELLDKLDSKIYEINNYNKQMACGVYSTTSDKNLNYVDRIMKVGN